MMGSQMSKTDGVCLNIIGHRLDDDPVPIIYVGPTRSNVDAVIEPRIAQMIKSSESLWGKLSKGRKAKRLVKRIAGVSLRLAWAGSATELASQAAGLVIVDEVDRMEEVGGEGDPVTLVEARLSTYPDSKMVLDSTPTIGSVEMIQHPETKIWHWKVADAQDVQSPIWQYWQEGSRHEWAVQCQACDEYFIPRFNLLVWVGHSPTEAFNSARLACSRCGYAHEEIEKASLNRSGKALSYGQTVIDGQIVGEEPETDRYSLWVSGLMSPWVSFGESARRWVRAVASKDPGRIQGIINTRFGELYRIKGEAPEWQRVKECDGEYKTKELPDFTQRLYLTVDVQQDCLIWNVRAWGYEFCSGLVEEGRIWGDTDKPQVWAELEGMLTKTYDGKAFDKVAVDSGFNTAQVYSFCQRHKGLVLPTKGKENPTRLLQLNEVEVDERGKKRRLGIKLCTFDLNHFKTWIHDRIGWPKDRPGVWLVPEDVSDEYCRQIVAEQKLTLPSGKTKWVRVNKENHQFDCEVLQVALATLLDVRHLLPLNEDGTLLDDTMELAALAKRANASD